MDSVPKESNGAAAFLTSQNGQRALIAAFSVVATLVLVWLPGTAFAYAFGLPFLFFVPGFALVRLFFWKGTSMEAKFVLSLGLSIIAVIALAFILVLTPIGLASDTSRLSLVVFTLAAVALETFWLRADRARKDEPKTEAPPEPAPEPTAKPDKVVAAMIATALVISGISLGLIVTAEYPSRTSFALTDENGLVVTNTTRDLNTSLVLVFHVKNGEDGARDFTVEAYASNVDPNGTEVFTNMTFEKAGLAKGGEWNQSVTLFFGEASTFRINLDLYIQAPGSAPVFYGQLHMWFKVQ